VAAENPTAETPTAETPTAETPTAETPTAETPTAETPTAENPTAENPHRQPWESSVPTALTAATARRTPDPAPRRRLRGPAWLAWRQQRLLLCTALVLLAAASAVLLWQHAIVSHDFAVLTASHCSGTQDLGQPRCFPALDYLSDHGADFTSTCQPALAALPVLIGMFVGAPLLAQEYERGGNRLAWSQSVSRLRWLASRLAVPLALVAVGSTLLALLAHWVYWDLQSTPAMYSDGPFRGLTYPVIGPVAVATALFALALGTALGVLLRRTLLAVGLTGLLVLLAEVALRQVRPYLWPLAYATQPNGTGTFQQPTNALLVSSGTLLPNGVRVPQGDCGSDRACLAARTAYGYYQPVAHLWPIQLVESGILLALALALFALTVHRVRRGPA
jgi:hypothetical protein